jgi:voltage-gated potassium channel
VITLVLCALGLTAVTVIMHGAGTAACLRRFSAHGASRFAPASLVSLLLLLHLAEALVWALFMVLIGALPSVEAAAYFSLTSYTTVGYGDVLLPERWRLLGPIEAAVGILMLGWSTGILVAVIGKSYREQVGP